MTHRGEAFGKNVAGELRAERGRKRKTLSELSGETELARTTVINYLNGRRVIPVTALADLAYALDVSPSQIVERAEKQSDT